MKRNSGIIGGKKEPTLFDGSSGVFGLHDQFIEKRNGTWPIVIKYLSCTESTSTVSEGNTVTFTVTTEALPAESLLYYTISTVSGTTMDAADFGGTAISNSFSHNDNSTVLGFTLTAEYPGDVESNSFKLQIRTGSTSGPIQLESGTVTVTDVTGTDVPTGGVLFTTVGQHSWTAPTGVTSVCAVAIGGGGGGLYFTNTNVAVTYAMSGGGGGALAWLNDYTVVPGNSYSIVVGAGGSGGAYAAGGTDGGGSYAFGLTICKANGGAKGLYNTDIGSASKTTSTSYGTSGGGGGGAVDSTASNGYGPAGGGGAGGYSGNGGTGRDDIVTSGGNGSGGGGAGGGASDVASLTDHVSGGGGGTGVYGEGSSGTGSTEGWGGGGSGGEGGGTDYHGSPGGPPVANQLTSINGGDYGGGGGGQAHTVSMGAGAGAGGQGAVRIIWGTGRAFPSTNVGYTSNETTV